MLRLPFVRNSGSSQSQFRKDTGSLLIFNRGTFHGCNQIFVGLSPSSLIEADNCRNMAGQLSTKLRLVRCPGCHGILPELAPVYQCAGCGIVLQAKKRKNDTDTGQHINETDTAWKNELEHVSGDKEAQSLSQEETQPSTAELPWDKNAGSNQNEIQGSDGEQSGDAKFSNGLSMELTCCVNEESSPAVTAEIEVDQDECSLEQNNGGDQNEYGYCYGKRLGCASFSNEVASSSELNHPESEESLAVSGAHSEEDLEPNNKKNQNEYGYCNGKKLGGLNFPDEVASTEIIHHKSEELSLQTGVHSELDENGNCLEQNNGRHQSAFGDFKRALPGNIEFSNEISSSTEVTCQEIEDSSPVAGTITELEENFKSRFIFGSSSGGNLLAASPGDSMFTAQMSFGESNSMDNQMSPHSKHLGQSQKRAFHGKFDRVSSDETLENFALDMPKSPTTRSYYANGCGVSSDDGTDDQVPDLHLHLSKRKCEAESAGTKATPRDEVMNKLTSSYPELQHQAWSCSSSSSERKHYLMKGSVWCQDESVESTKHGHPVRSGMRFETDERQSKVPFYSRGDHIGCSNGGPSNYGQNHSQYSTSLHSPNKPEYPEEEKMELLKMVYELQDQLKRTHLSKGNANGSLPGVAWMEKQISSYYDHTEPEAEICHDLNNPGYSRRCNQGRNWPHRSQILGVPFSAEATISKHQVYCSCFHCCPQAWQCSALLPPHICYNKSQYTAHPNQKCYDLYRSSPSSPHHCAGSEFSSRSCDLDSDYNWHTNHHEVKKYSRERHHSMKRHILPVAGGTPFLVCYGCLELLQLPADFLLSGRRCRKLRCGACSAILNFALKNGTHIVLYTDFSHDDIDALPPSKVDDDCSDANNVRNLESVSYAGNCPHADPVSCSDDCGPSVRRSCSTEGEPFSTPLPFHSRNRESNDGKMSSSSSFEPVEERKKQLIFRDSQNKFKNSVESFASAGYSSKRSKAEKPSSEIEELPRKAGSPLHRLMGYSSPSEVMER